MNFLGSKTYQNLMTAYGDERKASSKYRLYALIAREAGYGQIANLFREIAENEQQHGQMWLKYLGLGYLPTTLEALEDASSGEYEEWSALYPSFAQTANSEGYEEIARKFSLVGQIERQHEDRFRKLIQNLETDHVFCREGPQSWICQACGHITLGACSLALCPVCGSPQAFTEIMTQNY